MKYILLICADEQTFDDARRQHCYGESLQLVQELNSSGHYLADALLQPTSTAASVRMRERKRIVTDGPFAETREPTWRLLRGLPCYAGKIPGIGAIEGGLRPEKRRIGWAFSAKFPTSQSRELVLPDWEFSKGDQGKPGRIRECPAYVGRQGRRGTWEGT
jgi:hypothetical protein